MSYRQLKWLILIIPTLVIGLWEYLRHQFLLPYISMELGNWLSPVIVFIVTITFLRRLFMIYEHMQEQLKTEREEKAILQERERIARELHDGIAQTLFLCSVQINRLKEKQPDPGWTELDKSLRQIHDYVRHSISNLKNPPHLSSASWQKRVEELISQFQLDTGISVHPFFQLNEANLQPKEKVELFSCIQEALTNIRKHAHADHVWIQLTGNEANWCLKIEDDGTGFQTDPFRQSNRFGLRIMRERVQEIGGTLLFNRMAGKTQLVIKKEGHR